MEKTYGKICEIPFCFHFEWELPKFFSLIQNRKEYDSPEFEFYGAKWNIVIRRHSPERMNFVLIKRTCIHKKHHVNFKVSIKESDGTEYESANGKHVFFSFASFSEILNVRYKDLQRDKHKISYDGTLTVSCALVSAIAINVTSTDVKTDTDEFHEEMANSIKKREDVIGNTNKGITSTVTVSEKLIRDMEALFSTGQDSDVTLVVRDRNFPVHRAILGIRSPVFAAMFAHDLKEKTSGIVNIMDFDPDVFHEFLLYFYTASVEKLSSKTVLGLYAAADKYDTQELKAKCVEFMTENLSVNMIFSVISLALQHKESSLLEAATKFFIKNLKQIIVTVDWQQFMKENPDTANELLIKASGFYALEEEKL